MNSTQFFFRNCIRYRDIATLVAFSGTGYLFSIESISEFNSVRFAASIAGCILFIAHVFFYNDYIDDASMPSEKKRRNRHLMKFHFSSHLVLMSVMWLPLGFSLLFFILLPLNSQFLLLMAWILTFLYSSSSTSLKGIPYISLLVFFGFAILFFHAGWVVNRPFNLHSIAWSSFMALILVGGHFFNELEDLADDLKARRLTNAIKMGEVNAFKSGLVFFWLASVLITCYNAFNGPHVELFLSVLLLFSWSIVAFITHQNGYRTELARFRRLYRGIFAGFLISMTMVHLYSIF